MSKPYGCQDFEQQLQTVGIQQGDAVIVHSSLKSFDWLTGDSRAVIVALCRTVGRQGLVVMPTQTPELSDPSLWTEGPEPQENWQPIRDRTMGYDPQLTPAIGQSWVVELFRNYPGVYRTNHPLDSFAAWGERADWLTTTTTYDFPFGDEGVLGKLYQLRAKIVMIGTDFETNTALHLAGTRLNRSIKVVQETAPIEVGSFLSPKKKLVTFDNVELETYDFQKLEREFVALNQGMKTADLAKGKLRAVDMRTCVEFAEDRFKTYPYVS